MLSRCVSSSPSTLDQRPLTAIVHFFEQTIKLNPSFAKGYGRKGGALHGARQFDEAIAAYEEGLKIAPGDAALQKGLTDVKRAAGAWPVLSTLCGLLLLTDLSLALI